MDSAKLLELLPIGEVARRLDRSTQQVRVYIDAGELPAVLTQLGRLVDPADVETFRQRRDHFGRYRRQPVLAPRGSP